MNVLILNPVHPSTPHISAVRAFRFAQELSGFGHRVVLATRQVEPGASDSIATEFESPLVLEVASSSAGQPPERDLLNRLRTAYWYVRDGGWDHEWGRAVVRQVEEQAPRFSPDVIWVSFGKMEAIVAARRIAHRLNVPWVFDMKDNWEFFVPRGLQQLMVRRTNGFSAATSNSEFFARMFEKWHGAPAHLVYSGVEDTFLPTQLPALPTDRLTLNLIGGTYFEDVLRTLLQGVDAWCRASSIPVQIQYMGVDRERFESVSATLTHAEGEALGYLPVVEMAQKCARVHANMYVGNPGTFHHKLLELACVGRPLIACPGDGEEAHRLVREVGVSFHEAPDSKAIGQALDAAWSEANQAPIDNNTQGQRFSWTEQARKLESVLAQAARGQVGRP